MSTREELEAALRARPDDATLVVYADLLQAQGDPRGELIALDLRPPDQSSSALETRRGQLLGAWLGDELDLHWDRDAQLWLAGELDTTYATFDCGFVDLFVDEHADDAMLAHLLHGPAGAYLRRVSLRGSTDLLATCLAHLAGTPRPWLQQLAVARPGLGSRLVDGALEERLAVALPNLEVLDLVGRNLLDRFAHPNLRELGVIGSRAIDLVDGPPLPALHTLDYAFDGDWPTPRGLVHHDRVPALRRLDFSRAEPGVRAFTELGTLAVASQITRLVLPSLRTPRDHALVQAAIDRMPRLRELVFARAYLRFGHFDELRHASARVTTPPAVSWPPRDEVENDVLIDGHPVALPPLVDALEEQYDDLPEEVRAIWYRFWTLLDLIEHEQAIDASDLLRAVEALDAPCVDSLREWLRVELGHRRSYFAVIRR